VGVVQAVDQVEVARTTGAATGGELRVGTSGKGRDLLVADLDPLSASCRLTASKVKAMICIYGQAGNGKSFAANASSRELAPTLAAFAALFTRVRVSREVSVALALGS
jgi:hypothetical protein